MQDLETIEEIDEFINSGDIRMVYLSRPSCGVCKALIPKIETMLEDYPEAKPGYVDLDKIPEAAGKFSIFTIPGILVFIQGKESIRKARYVSVDQLSGEIGRYYSLLYN